MKMRLVVLFFVFALAMLGSVFGVEDQATLLVKRDILNDEVVVGRDTVINIDIFNVGTGDAFDVELTDDTWSKDAWEQTLGLSSAEWDQIPAGSNVSHSFVLKALNEGLYTARPAEVRYRLTKGGHVQRVLSSNPSWPVYVVPSGFSSLRTGPRFAEWGVFLLLAVLSSIGPFLTWFYLSRNYQHGLKKEE